MSNEEFDLLKEELTWQGSKVAVLRYGISSVQIEDDSHVIARGDTALKAYTQHCTCVCTTQHLFASTHIMHDSHHPHPVLMSSAF